MNKKNVFILSLLLAIPVVVCQAQDTAGMVDPNNIKFEKNLNKPEREEWLRDLGFGLFIHWAHDSQLGIVISHSLVGASEDYCQRYFNELPQTFDPYKFDPREWMKIAKLMGVGYVVFTTKHHSGFCMWDTKTTSFNIMNTPYKKDILRELTDAIREAVLAVGYYFSPDDFKFLYDNGIVINRRLTFEKAFYNKYSDFLKSQIKELYTNYGKIDILFIDGQPADPVRTAAWEVDPDVVITRGVINTPEQNIPRTGWDELWESCFTMGNQWQYKPTNDELKSGTRVIEMLIETRAKGGNLLLNIGPHPDGYIPIEQEERMREVAAWMFINQESIYNVRPWVTTNEDNLWFTKSKDGKAVYVYITGIPDWRRDTRREFILKSVRATANTKASVLGQNDLVSEYNAKEVPDTRFEQTPEGLKISCVRAQRIYNNNRWPNPIVLKLENVVPVTDN